MKSEKLVLRNIKSAVQDLLKEIEKRRKMIKSKLKRQFDLIEREVERDNSLMAWSYSTELLGDVNEYFVLDLIKQKIKHYLSDVIE